MSCRICGNSQEKQSLIVPELMYGLLEKFQYYECPNCECLQIAEFPKDMSIYYGDNYFSPKNTHSSFNLKRSTERWMLRTNKILKKPVINKFWFTAFEPAYISELLKDKSLSNKSKILEVGSGRGSLLISLFNVGFKNLTAVEPYSITKLDDRIKVLKGTLTDLKIDEKYDLIIFNHSLEHIPNQLETLKKAASLLTKNGRCLIRIPIKTKYIWHRYGIFWVQLDAPRHFYLHTLRSFRILTERSGFRIVKGFFDSNEFQFWGSEQYIKNIPLKSEKSYLENPEKSIFSKKQIKEYVKLAKENNKTEQGDQATFYLKRAD